MCQTLMGEMSLILSRFTQLRDALQKPRNAVGDGSNPPTDYAKDISEVIEEFEILWPFWKKEALRMGVDLWVVTKLEREVESLKASLVSNGSSIIL